MLRSGVLRTLRSGLAKRGVLFSSDMHERGVQSGESLGEFMRPRCDGQHDRHDGRSMQLMWWICRGRSGELIVERIAKEKRAEIIELEGTMGQ